ncbi:MAG TPA: recombination regulator RecX [Burkholderiaceae bacterium]|nr:recombination regulator RecX [Burkholderiaceae bacterium]
MNTDDDFETLAPKRSGPSLKARAVGYLSRREHSRLELARKLAPYADNADQVEQLLDGLERENWLSDERFVQSLVNRRAGRHGVMRILQELRQHGIAEHHLSQVEHQLRDSELDRARDVWEKKFGVHADNTKDYARQYRFMMSRGFSAECVRRLLGDLPR